MTLPRAAETPSPPPSTLLRSRHHLPVEREARPILRHLHLPLLVVPLALPHPRRLHPLILQLQPHLPLLLLRLPPPIHLDRRIPRHPERPVPPQLVRRIRPMHPIRRRRPMRPLPDELRHHLPPSTPDGEDRDHDHPLPRPLHRSHARRVCHLTPAPHPASTSQFLPPPRGGF